MKVVDKRGDEKELTRYLIGDVILRLNGDKKELQMVSAHPVHLAILDDGNYLGSATHFCMVDLGTGINTYISDSLEELFEKHHKYGDRLVKAHVVIERNLSHG